MKDEEKKPLTVTELARMGAAARNKALDARTRKKLAKRAARARWKKAKKL